MILVTGGSGFLGKAIIKEMQNRFRQDRDAGIKNTDRWNFFNYDLPRYTILDDVVDTGEENPITNYTIDQWVQEATAVIHVAAVANLNMAAAKRGHAVRTNIEGTMNVAKACARHKRGLLYISTACAYGNTEKVVVDEKCNCYPTEVYAWQKLFGEDFVREICPTTHKIIRLSTLYGPGMRPALFHHICLTKAMDGGTLTIHGDGNQGRTYCYIEDAAAAVVKLLEVGNAGEVFNVAGDEYITVNDIIAESGKLIGVNGKPVFKVVHGPDREGQIPNSRISNEKMKSLGWSPKTDHKSGMAQTLEWLRKQRSKT